LPTPDLPLHSHQQSLLCFLLFFFDFLVTSARAPLAAIYAALLRMPAHAPPDTATAKATQRQAVETGSHWVCVRPRARQAAPCSCQLAAVTQHMPQCATCKGNADRKRERTSFHCPQEAVFRHRQLRQRLIDGTAA